MPIAHGRIRTRSPVRVRPLRPPDCNPGASCPAGLVAAWSDYVARHPEATVFHELGWKRAVERAFGHRAHYFLAFDGDEIVGVLPVFEVRSVLAGRLLVSVPYATAGGVLADDRSAALALLDEAKSLTDRIGARSLELRCPVALDDQLPIRRTHATFRRALPSRVEDVAALFPRKARAAARRAAETNELAVRYDPACVPLVWRLYARSMRRLGSPNYPRAFFTALAEELGGAVAAQIVWLGRRPIAGLLLFLHRKTVMPYFVGTDERVEVYGLSQFLYAESMRWAVERGYEIYDFGRTRFDNRGAFEFKRLCGFEPQPLEYQVYLPPGRRAPDLAPTSSRWRAARRIWKSMPLPVTRPLGAWLTRSIPG